MKNETLQEMLNQKITAESLQNTDADTHGLVKIMISATMKERAYDFLNILIDEKRRQYTMDLFEKIETTPWYDFDLSQNGRYVIFWTLETVAEEEEIIEYFTECMQEFNQAFGDVVVDAGFKENPDKIIRIYTHDNTICTSGASVKEDQEQ